jgi:hypothetical protein
MKVVADAGAARPRRFLAAHDHLGELEILRRRDLDVQRITLNQLDPVAGTLEQRCFLGRIA